MTISAVIKQFETLTVLQSNNTNNEANLVYTAENNLPTTVNLVPLLTNSSDFVDYLKSLILNERDKVLSQTVVEKGTGIEIVAT